MKAYLPLVLVAAVGGLGFLLGLGSAAILGALTSMFCLMAAFGGTLRADLRLLAWFGPLLVVSVGATRVLGPLAPWAAMLLVAAVAFVASLLPALGVRYVTVGLGLGMAVVFGYGFQFAGAGGGIGALFAAPALGVAAVTCLRVAAGARDPGGPLRAGLAAALTATDGSMLEQTVRGWMADRPRRWTAAVLSGIFRYRTAIGVLTHRRRLLADPAAEEVDRLVAAGREEAARLAESLAAAEARANPEPVRRRPPHVPLPGATAQLVTSMWQGLEAVRAADLDRDGRPSDLPKHLARDALLSSLRGALSWRSVQLRHAIRCALGMLAALVVARFFANSPLVLVFLLSTFMIMQPTRQDSLTRAWQRVGGTLAGAAALALVVWLLRVPDAALVPVGVGSLLVGFAFQRTRPVVFNACTVLMGVTVNVAQRHLDPREVLLQYLLLMLVAVAIGLLFGFVVVPGVRTPGITERFDDAVRATRALLRGVAAVLLDPNADRRGLQALFREAAGAAQNLTAGAAGGGAEPDERQRSAADQAAEALRGLRVTALALLSRSRTGGPLGPALHELARQLDPSADLDPEQVAALLPGRLDDEQRLLVDGMAADLLTVHDAAPALRRSMDGPVGG